MPASTSIAAFHTLDLPELEAEVLRMIESFGANGCTVDEILEVFEIDYRTLTPRFAPLERKGLIFRAGDTRTGKSGRQQRVRRHSKYAAITPVVTTPPKKNPFLEGMKYAAKILLRNCDLTSAKADLKNELLKVAKS